MIRITRKLAKQLRSLFRRTANLSRSHSPVLHFQTGPDGLRVRLRTADAAIQYHQSGDLPPDELLAPFTLLADCEGTRSEPVQLERDGEDGFTAAWQDSGIPQLLRYEIPPDPPEFPAGPETLADNPPELFPALHQAMQSTDRESVRYALGAVQLAGSAGRIAATNGRQIFGHSGFAFPFEEDLLLPYNTIFGCKEVTDSDAPIRIGRRDNWLTIAAGAWTFHLSLLEEGRFPNISQYLESGGAAAQRLQIAPADAEFLTKSLVRLPEHDEFHHPVTVDLNGSVAIRAQNADRTQTTELLLTGSNYTGEPLRFSTNRTFLARAIELGFREIDLTGIEAPAICRDDRRVYVWQLLNKEDVISPVDGAVRIESPGKSNARPARVNSTTNNHQNRSHAPPMTASKPNTNSNSNSNSNSNTNSNGRHGEGAGNDAQSIEDLIAQAEAVKTSLRETTGQINDLIAALKRQRKQNRLVQSTLASLRQLQSIAG